MNYKFNFLPFLLCLFILTGCTISKQVVGEYYLQEKNYAKGYEHFKRKVTENDKNAASQYYYARFLLAKKDFTSALKHFKLAANLDPSNSDYYSWMGVAYSYIKQVTNERNAYKKALSLNKNNLQALTYLAHNYYDAKEYKTALKYYANVLKLFPSSQSAMYNSAVILKKLKRTPEEINAWKRYLEYYPAGRLARNAVFQLNKQDNYEYRNFLIGIKTITLKQISFEPLSSDIHSNSKSSLSVLGKVLEENKDISIHIVVYQLNNKLLAKEKSKKIKNYIIGNYPDIDTDRLKLSWFDKSKRIKMNKKYYQLNTSIDFITIIK